VDIAARWFGHLGGGAPSDNPQNGNGVAS
jgi:hypothetical protein